MSDATTDLFPLGEVVATPAAIKAIREAGQTPFDLLTRHRRGDWGDLDADDRRLNDGAVKDGSRILSAYPLRTGTKVWVITEAAGDDGRRASTCLLLPDEY
jgi:hypothetical protein